MFVAADSIFFILQREWKIIFSAILFLHITYVMLWKRRNHSNLAALNKEEENSISLKHYQILLTEIARKTHIIDFFCHKFCRSYDLCTPWCIYSFSCTSNSPSIALYCLTEKKGIFPCVTLQNCTRKFSCTSSSNQKHYEEKISLKTHVTFQPTHVWWEWQHCSDGMKLFHLMCCSWWW